MFPTNGTILCWLGYGLFHPSLGLFGSQTSNTCMKLKCQFKTTKQRKRTTNSWQQSKEKDNKLTDNKTAFNYSLLSVLIDWSFEKVYPIHQTFAPINASARSLTLWNFCHPADRARPGLRSSVSSCVWPAPHQSSSVGLTSALVTLSHCISILDRITTAVCVWLRGTPLD